MVKFKCIASGNIIQFQHEVDIVTTRANPAYEEVIVEEPKQQQETVKVSTKKVSKAVTPVEVEA